MQKIICLIISFFTILALNSHTVFAQSLDFSFDSPVRLEERFKVNFTVDDLSGNSKYRAKIRIGAPSNLIAGQTLNHGTDHWLPDWENWQNFPVFTSDEDGFLSGQLMARLTDTYSPGQYKIALAMSEDGKSNEFESEQKTIDFLGAVTNDQEASVGGLPETGGNELSFWLYLVAILSTFGGTLILRRQLVN